jgi:hypothetical protein
MMTAAKDTFASDLAARSQAIVASFVLASLAGLASWVDKAQATAITVGSFYEEGSDRMSLSPPAAGACSNTNDCHIIFNTVATGKQLLVTEATCDTYTLGPSANFFYMAELRSYPASSSVPSDRRQRAVPTLALSINSGEALHVVTITAKHLVKAGERPVITLRTRTAGGFNASCTIFGKIGNPPTE